jgi:predicted dehydrogenase
MNPSPLKRRSFLKLTAASAHAAAVGSLPLVASANVAGSDVIKVGVIGCGGRNTGAAVQALTADPGARLVAMADIFMSRIKGAREAIRGELARIGRAEQLAVADDHCFAGFDAYKAVIAASDVVLIANAAKFHPHHMMAAIEAGKHVFCEKPHGIDPAGIAVLRAATELAGQKHLSVVSGLHSRYHDGYAETIQRIHDGAIGDIVSIEENFLRGPYGIVDRDPSLSELLWQCSSQYHFTWLSGDDVVQSLVHNIDRARWAMREKSPVKCHGLGGRSSMTSPIYGNVFDHHSVVYEFDDGVRLYAFCRTTLGCHDDSSSRIFGTKGRADITRCEIRGATNWRWRGECNPYQNEHDRLFASIRAGSPVNNGDYMADSTQTAIMGQISCYTGREVAWEQVNRSSFGYPPAPADCCDGMEPPVVPGPGGSYPVLIPGQSKLL